ncbi:MAG: ATP-binding cassette domain-containing protein [Pseudonocardiaceae bacterium]|nr:ATP-binding cassette domain-containing protein [Pseudonocardiaceae bacterium]
MTDTVTWLRDEPLLRVQNLVCQFKAPGGTVHAVSDITFDLLRGETLGLVGESGCGKSTTGRAILQLPPPTEGSVVFEDRELTGFGRGEMREVRRRLQMIFQDPISSLNPRRKVRDIVAEGLTIAGVDKERSARTVDAVLHDVGMDPEQVGDRRPHEFSGGQCQRIAIARAMAIEPSVLICDEPVASLDVSVQAQILNLLEDMKTRYGLSLIFISHDLAVVHNVSDRIAVMYLGKIVEIGQASAVYSSPAHPYTMTLLDAVPVPDPEVAPSERVLEGELPSPLRPPSGCRFRTRCPLAQQVCADLEPTLQPASDGHYVACHFPSQPLPELPLVTSGNGQSRDA